VELCSRGKSQQVELELPFGEPRMRQLQLAADRVHTFSLEATGPREGCAANQDPLEP
jgi:hypothetical protein